MSIISQKLTPDKVKLGVTPTLWWNDDFPQLDIGITFGQCVSEMAYAGFQGCSVGHKYPTDPDVLKPELALRGLTVSEPWTSTYFTIKAMEEQTIKSFHASLDFIKEMGGKDIVVAEFGQAVNPLPVAVFANRPKFDDQQWAQLLEGLSHIGKIANENGMRLCYHPHMGTGVMVKEDIDRLMANTDPDLVHLLLDTGHLAFAGADPLQVTQQYAKRIKHIHLKDVRAQVIADAHAHGYSFCTAIENGVFTVPGDPEGAIDCGPILTALAEADFEGWLVVEAEQDPAKAKPLKYAKMARAYLRETLGW
jgi:inosose dehydratase